MKEHLWFFKLKTLKIYLFHKFILSFFSFFISLIFEFINFFIVFVTFLLLFFFYELDSTQYFISRILPFHVATAWVGLFNYSLVFLLSLNFLLFLVPLLFLVAQKVIQFGLFLLFFILFSGIIWAIFSWGNLWILDTRLLAIFLLFFIYIIYIRLSIENNQNFRIGIITSLLILFSSIDLPLIKFSVDWWNTLHQSETFKERIISLNFIIFLTNLNLVFFLCFNFFIFLFFSLREEIINYKNYFIFQYIKNTLNTTFFARIIKLL